MKRPTYLFSGDRDWGDPYIVDIVMMGIYTMNRMHQEKPIIVQGTAKGLDSIAMMKASGLGMTVHGYPPQWKQFGKAAGPKRNQQMLVEEEVNIAFAFHDDLTLSKGTKDMVERCVIADIPTYVISHA
jgi:hypothetical protein